MPETPSSAPLDRSAIAALIPHAGAMCLLDRVAAWDTQQLHARSASHLDLRHPLRGPAGLHAVHLAEYGAQAMALHGALRERAAGPRSAPRAGRLVSLRELELSVENVPAHGVLDVHAVCLYADPRGAQYAFRVALAGALLACGRVAVIHPEG